MDTNKSNTHADPLLGSRWAQMWVHMWAQTLVILLVYVTKGNLELSIYSAIPLFVSIQENLKMSSCVNAVLIHLACNKHLSHRQLTDTTACIT